ncbi:MAG: hypothetical protein IPK97_09445 [Ahniella sp.]|nr:hypothetical protein [Ahniella sp.]
MNKAQSVESKEQPADARAEAGGDRNVDQIRDILFGGQMRDYERRFGELSSRLEQDAARLRSDFDSRVSALEKRMDEQFDRLHKALRQEVQDRGQSLDDLESRHQQASRTQRSEVNASISNLQSDLAATDERLRAVLADLQTALKVAGERADGALGQTREELRRDKVSREDLAGMLAEVALRLKGQFDLGVVK